MTHLRGTALRSPSGMLSRRTGRWLASVGTVLMLASLCDRARAADWGNTGPDATAPSAAKPTPDDRSGWSVGAAVHTPISVGVLSEDGQNQVALMMAGLDADLSVGHSLGRTTRLAYELSLGLRGTLTELDRYELRPYDNEAPASVDGMLTYFLPLGMRFDLLPEAPAGLFGSLHGGVGTFSAPDFMTSGNLALAGRGALDIGWVMPLEKGSLALSARYSLLALKLMYIDEAYNNRLTLHELSFGVAWNL